MRSKGMDTALQRSIFCEGEEINGGKARGRCGIK